LQYTNGPEAFTGSLILLL